MIWARLSAGEVITETCLFARHIASPKSLSGPLKPDSSHAPSVRAAPNRCCAPALQPYRRQHMSSNRDLVAPLDTFARRHLGSDSADIAAMLRLLDPPSLDALADAAVPPQIRLSRPLSLPAAAGESAALAELLSLIHIS